MCSLCLSLVNFIISYTNGAIGVAGGKNDRRSMVATIALDAARNNPDQDPAVRSGMQLSCNRRHMRERVMVVKVVELMTNVHRSQQMHYKLHPIILTPLPLILPKKKIITPRHWHCNRRQAKERVTVARTPVSIDTMNEIFHYYTHNKNYSLCYLSVALAGTLKANGTPYMTQSEKGKSSTGKPRTGGLVSTNLVIRDGNEMWYSSITDKPMINKLIELGVFQSTMSQATVNRKMKTLKEKASKGEFKLVAGKDLWLSAPVEIPKGAIPL